MRVLMVASGGCSAAYLAARRGTSLELVDPNPAQLALARLKLHLLQSAEPTERMRLLGRATMDPERRGAQLEQALGALGLEPDALGEPAGVARAGPDHCGRYERVFEELRRHLDPELVERLLALRGGRARAAFLERHPRLSADLEAAVGECFGGAALTAIFGPQATANPRRPFSVHFTERLFAVLTSDIGDDNPYLADMLGGRQGTRPVPWLELPRQPEPAPCAFANTDMLGFLRECEDGSRDLIQLSNILDWLEPARGRELLAQVRRVLAPGGCVLIRQLNSALDVPALAPALAWDREWARVWLARDRSFFYRALHLGWKR